MIDQRRTTDKIVRAFSDRTRRTLTTSEPPAKKLPLGEVGEMKANEVAGEKTSFCPESLAGCSPFAKVRCNSYYPLVPVSTSLLPRRPGPPVLATDVDVHVVRVRRRTCTREHARCRDERKRERKRERKEKRKREWMEHERGAREIPAFP